ncbi:LOW QUALITY PROTEIN: hypothetical protein MKX08_004036 [Trichoderma sp. CBMAI-0020]|nr:LOW QUALITY PROTEIN: hypothetical protein MKX08_004036 [Trichoderma sp. CBMAI-0020]
MAEMQQLSDDLNSLNKSQIASPSSCPADSPHSWDYNAEGDGTVTMERAYEASLNVAEILISGSYLI